MTVLTLGAAACAAPAQAMPESAVAVAAWWPMAGLLLAVAVIAGWGWTRLRRPADAIDASHRPQAHTHSQATGTDRGDALRALMRLLPDGVLLLEDARIVHANPACEAMFGQPPGALPGLSACRLVPEDGRAPFQAWLQAPAATMDGGPPSRRMCRRDGSVFQAAVTRAQLEHDGSPCTLLVVRDLSDAERMRDELAAGNRELQALAARVFTLQEDERRAISRELHDDIGQSVTAMKMAASSALDEDDVQRRRDDLEDILVLADATLERLRDISILLRPPQLDALGLEAALRWHAERLLRSAGLVPALQIDPLPRRPEPEVEQACFRIAQEALTNTVRHAGASRVALRLRDTGDGLHLCVDDDGAGFSPAAARGLGLVIMRERAQGVGGRLEVSASPGAGTRIEAWLPYAQSAAHAGDLTPGR